MATADGSNAPITITGQVSANINRQSITGECTAQYIPDENAIRARMQFRPVFRPLMMCSSTSVLSSSCSVFSRALYGAVNIAALFERRLHATVEFRMQDFGSRVPGDQHIFGLITQEMTLERVSTTEYRFQTTLNGWANRSPEIGTSTSTGYSMHMRQVGPSEIEGLYGQVVTDTQGNTYYTFTRRKYRYEGPATLPSDQTMMYHIMSITERLEGAPNETHIVDFHSQAYYTPTAYRLLY